MLGILKDHIYGLVLKNNFFQGDDVFMVNLAIQLSRVEFHVSKRIGKDDGTYRNLSNGALTYARVRYDISFLVWFKLLYSVYLSFIV